MATFDIRGPASSPYFGRGDYHGFRIRGMYSAPAPPTPDSTAPVVSNIDPPPNSEITRTQAIEFDVTDNLGLFCRIFVIARFADGTEEVVHKGATAFSPLYASGSVRNTITNGYHYRVARSTGWPSVPTFEAIAIDSDGNEST